MNVLFLPFIRIKVIKGKKRETIPFAGRITTTKLTGKRFLIKGISKFAPVTAVHSDFYLNPE